MARAPGTPGGDALSGTREGMTRQSPARPRRPGRPDRPRCSRAVPATGTHTPGESSRRSGSSSDHRPRPVQQQPRGPERARPGALHPGGWRTKRPWFGRVYL